MNKKTVAAILHEVLQESGESLDAGTFDELVDRLATPAAQPAPDDPSSESTASGG